MSNDDIGFAELKQWIVEWHRKFVGEVEQTGASKEDLLEECKEALNKISSTSRNINLLRDLQLSACQLRCYEITRVIDDKCDEMNYEVQKGMKKI